MCLWEVTKEYKRPLSKQIVAWKILEQREYSSDPELLFTPFQGIRMAAPGNWMRVPRVGMYDIPILIGAFPQDTKSKIPDYDPGFHSFKSRKIAERALELLTPTLRPRRVYPVMIKGITCYGPDGASSAPEYVNANLTTYVSRWMRLLTEEERRSLAI